MKPPTTPWQAIWSDQATYKLPDLGQDLPLKNITLWLELIGPRVAPPRRDTRPANPVPLRLWRGASGGDLAISVYLMPDGAIRLIHGEIDICTAPRTLRAGETLGLRYTTCAQGRLDGLEVTNFDLDHSQFLRSGLACRARLADAMPASDLYLSVVHMAAVASDIVPESDIPGLEAGGMVATVEGPRLVEDLRAGDGLLADDGTAHPLRMVQARPRLCLGRKAPVRLKAPYFDLNQSLVVTPQTRLLRSGSEVEYLCGVEAVLVTAADMIAGRAAVHDRSKPVRMFYHLLLDDPTCIRVNNCLFETARLSDMMAMDGRQIDPAANPFDATPRQPFPVLDRAAARALITANVKVA